MGSWVTTSTGQSGPRHTFICLPEHQTVFELFIGTYRRRECRRFRYWFHPSPNRPPSSRYLDHVEERIRRYVSGKQNLIQVLEEEKQAVIHRAVTRGLDPNVSLKPSGVEWLGDIPAHWEVAALRHRYPQSLGKMLDSKRITGSHPLPYLRNTDIQWDRINTEGLPTMDISPDEYDRYTVRHGDLLVCEGGELAGDRFSRNRIWSGT